MAGDDRTILDNLVPPGAPLRATCQRCAQEMTKQDRRFCKGCRRYVHRWCWKAHQHHAHTSDDRAPFNGRRFF